MNKTGKIDQAILLEVENQEAWEELLQKDGLKVVEIYQEWSGPCHAIVSLFKLIKNELNDDMLIFASACAEDIESLSKYRGRSEPYFLFYGASTLVAIVRGADPPKLDQVIRNMLKQEHEAFSGDAARIEIEDEYLRIIEEAKEAAARRKALEREIDQEFAVFLIHPDILKTNIADEILQMLSVNGFSIVLDNETNFDDDTASNLLDSELQDPDYVLRVNNFLNGPIRCLLITKGPKGVQEALSKLVGPDPDDENADETTNGKAPSIRDLYGNGAPKSVVTFTNTKESAELFRSILFPTYEQPKVIIYAEEEVKEKIPDSDHDSNSGGEEDSALQSETQSSDIPEYNGPPRSVIMVRPSAATHYADKIKETVISAGFDLQSAREVTFTEEQAKSYFEDLSSFKIFDEMIAETISGPTLFLVVSKLDVYKELKELLGSESYSQAVENNPQSLRALFSSLPDFEKPNDLTWLQATLSDAATQKDLQSFFPIESTLAALKPDSKLVQDELLDLIKSSGFKIAARKEYTMNVDDVKVLYEQCIDKPYFGQLVDNLTSDTTLFLVLLSQDAVQRWRKLMGCSDPEKAVDSYPDDVDPETLCLRAVYGRTAIENAMHGSSSLEHAKTCINQIFGPNWDGKKTKTEDEEILEELPLSDKEADAVDPEQAAEGPEASGGENAENTSADGAVESTKNIEETNTEDKKSDKMDEK